MTTLTHEMRRRTFGTPWRPCASAAARAWRRSSKRHERASRKRRSRSRRYAGHNSFVPATADRETAVFFGRNCGEAAALDVYVPRSNGRQRSAGTTITSFGEQRVFDGSVVITVGDNASMLATMFNDIQVAGRIDCLYAMPSETDIPIYVLRSPRAPLSEIGPTLRHYR